MGVASSPKTWGACAQCPDTPLTPWEGKEVSGGQEEPSKVVRTSVTFATCLLQLADINHMHASVPGTLVGTGDPVKGATSSCRQVGAPTALGTVFPDWGVSLELLIRGTYPTLAEWQESDLNVLSP